MATSLLAPALGAEACGFGGPGPTTPAAFKIAAAVFVGTVENVTGHAPQPIVATFSVVKAYRGALKQPVNVSGYCDMQFSKGVTYVVYAYELNGVLMTSPLHRTRPLSAAADDIRCLENLPAGRPQSIIHGEVLRLIKQPDGSSARQALFEPLTVVAAGRHDRRSVVTDRWGPYQLVLAPGQYEVWVERLGRRVSKRQTLTLRDGDERYLPLTARY